jgi:hypothetical protein
VFADHGGQRALGLRTLVVTRDRSIDGERRSFDGLTATFAS